MTVLLLGGTAEARALAGRIEGRMPVIVSLRGVTSAPARYAGRVRTGGFGGVSGLRQFLVSEGIRAVIDATHPFAAQMTAHAVEATRAEGVAYLRLQRAPWQADTGWREVVELADAVAAIPKRKRVFLATGRGTDLAPLAARRDLTFVLRAIEPVETPLSHVDILLDRPPFTESKEVALFRQRRITHLVTKNAGGSVDAKLAAARHLGIAVLLIARPPLPAGIEVVPDVDAALDWLDAQFLSQKGPGAA